MVVAFRDGGEIEYLLLHYPAGHWDFPKGNVEDDEDMLTAAIREVEEETGIKELEVIEGFQETIGYFYRRQEGLVSKEVTYFLALTRIKDVVLTYEHIGYEWLSFKDALERLTYDNSKKILIKAHKHLLEHLSQTMLF
jgi:8-oxo-dGTP pyrophosphatase MutT (NUDIX family)